MPAAYFGHCGRWSRNPQDENQCFVPGVSTWTSSVQRIARAFRIVKKRSHGVSHVAVVSVVTDRSVFSRALDGVNDQHRDLGALGFQLQSKLLFERY
jgi:hypothetical protein